MKAMSLEQIRQAVGGSWLHKGLDQTVTAVTTDSRAAGGGMLFIALRGERFDAHNFLAQVADAGCPAAIVRMDAKLPEGVAEKFTGGLVGVADTQAALETLGAYHRTIVPAKVLAVTGSNGKTTVKRMIHHILSGRLKGTCSPKSFNNNIGLPLTLLGVGETDDYVVCEIGSNAPGEIAALSRIAQPDLAVITSVGSTHLEKLGSIDGVAREKASILTYAAPGGKAIVAGDSQPLAKALSSRSHKLTRFGFGADNDLVITNYVSKGLSCRFEVNGRLWVDLPMAGRHMASNALCAMAVAAAMGVSMADSAAAMASFAPADGRLETIACGEVTVINDAYNANPSSVLAAADVLGQCDATRRVMVVGDMRELGPDARLLHEETGRQIASRKIDLLIGVGELGRYIAVGAAPAVRESRQFETVACAMAELPGLLRAGDLVLIKGSRAMAMERIIDPICLAFGGQARSAEKGTH